MLGRKTLVALTLCLFGCLLTLASVFLPWWSSTEYEPNEHTPYVTQSLYILPAQYLIESRRLVVYREVPLNGKIALTALFLTILLMTAANLGIFGILIVHSFEKKKTGGIIISASGALCLLSTLIFYFMLPDALWPWFPEISEIRGYHFLPYGFQTAWGPTHGFFSTVIAGILLIIGGGIVAFFSKTQVNIAD